MAESCIHCKLYTLCRERAELAAARKEEAAKRVAAMTTEEALVFRAERRKKREVHSLVLVLHDHSDANWACSVPTAAVHGGRLNPCAACMKRSSMWVFIVQPGPMLTYPKSGEGTR